MSTRWYVRLTVAAVSLALVLLALPLMSAHPAKAAETRRIMSGWMPYWTASESTAAFLQNADLFSDVSPFWHDAKKDSASPSGITIANHTLSSSTRAAVLAQIKGKGADIIPSITDGSGRGTMAAVLKKPKKSAALVTQIVDLVTANGYDGIDLDFETFAFSDGSSSWAATRPVWVSFVANLAAALHAQGKKLTAAVPPIYNARQDGSSGYWVYDYKSIGASLDKLRIMAYDYSFDSPGPVGGPISWVDNLMKFSATQLPPEKIQLGTPTYGRDWVTKRKGTGCPTSNFRVIDTADIGTAIPGISEAGWSRDPASLERTVSYKAKYNGGKCTLSRTAFVPDSETVVAHAQLADKYGLNGIATWMVGSENPNQWPALRQVAQGKPVVFGSAGSSGQSLSVKIKPAVVTRRISFTLKGKLSPVRVGVVLDVQRLVNGKWVTKSRVATGAGGKYSVALKQAKKSLKYRIVAAPSGGYGKAKAGPITVSAR